MADAPSVEVVTVALASFQELSCSSPDVPRGVAELLVVALAASQQLAITPGQDYCSQHGDPSRTVQQYCETQSHAR
jgi:hypothetical protein